MDDAPTISPGKTIVIPHKSAAGLLLGVTGAVLLFLSICVGIPLARADTGQPIAVIFPDIGEPYREIFDQIIEGVEAKVGTPTANYPIKSTMDIAELKVSLLRQKAQVLIALGRQGMKTANELGADFKVIVGGVLTVPESDTSGQSVISLTPDPALLFAQMKSLKPTLKRVFVVYDPTINSWLLKLAKDSAVDQGLELVTYEASSLHSAIGYYQKILGASDSQTDALWLPQDSTTVEESTVLPLVLQKSWNQGIAVFSSNYSYVRRGVLFSLYPDNLALGQRLGAMAQGALDSDDYGKLGMVPLRDVKSAINLRTAKHLGISSKRQQSFDMSFPEQ